MESFLFVTKDVRFEETSPDKKFVRISATFLELDKPSIGSEVKTPKIYRFEEGTKIAKSLIGKPVYYGTDWAGAHAKGEDAEIGIVEKAVKLGKRIKGIVKVWINDKTSALVESLKSGGKFLFSVGGVAQFGKLIQKGKQYVQKLFNAVCTHLQMVPSGTKVGFPNAKMEQLVEVQETVMICENDVCPILKDIKECYGESCRVCNTEVVIPKFNELSTETIISESLHILPDGIMSQIGDRVFEEALPARNKMKKVAGKWQRTHITGRILGPSYGTVSSKQPKKKRKSRRKKKKKRACA